MMVREDCKLKPCPFCNAKYYGFDDDISIGAVSNPDCWWDSKLRGEDYAFVMCNNCGVILKADCIRDAIEAWNRRADNDSGTD